MSRLVQLLASVASGDVTLREAGRRVSRRLRRSVRRGTDHLPEVVFTPPVPAMPSTVEELRRHPTLCPLPWLHRYVHMDGKLHICCLTSQGHDAQPVITGDDGRELTAAALPSADEVTNSPYVRRVKREMMAGRWPAMCSRCQEAEVLGLPSRRQLENHPNAHLFLDLLGKTAPDGTSPPELNFVDLRLGNTCNLKCRMCHPISSTRIIPDYPAISGQRLTPSEIAEYTGITWHKDTRIWDSMEPELSTVRRIHFAGGEPLIMPGMADLLERCIRSGHAEHITLSYNTNVFRIPPRVLELWPHFQGLVLACSIDGHGSLNEYIRHPSSWDQIHRNLVLLDEHAERLNVYALRLHCTVQAYNVLYLDRLYDYVAQSGFRVLAPFIVVNPLNEPAYFDVRVLPPYLRAEAERRLEAVRERYGEMWAERCPEAPQHVDAVIAMLRAPMDAADREARVAEFVRVTRALDERRSEQLASCAPELVAAFGLGEVATGLQREIARETI
jgi:sulfatase maturation enzyme AslB (radical SAM superfamily)